jgi:hypothetical protein
MTRKMHKENVLGFKHFYKCEEMHRRWILSIPKWESLWKLEFWSAWNIWIKSVGSKKGPNCAPNPTLERSLEQESSFECTCSKDLFNYIYIGGQIGSFLSLALWAQTFKTLQNSYSQSDSHLGMLGTHLFCSLPHLWECVWVPRHFPNPLLLSWTFSLGHGPFSLGSILILSSWKAIVCHSQELVTLSS